MSLDPYFAKWAITAQAVVNHLWQSSLFAIVAGLLAWLLRRNHARIRYGLWLGASVKFLVPFALLVGLGSHLAVPHASIGTSDRFYFAIRQFSQPYLPEPLPGVPHPNPTVGSAGAGHLPILLIAAIWFTGFVAVLGTWCIGWRRVRVILRDAERMPAGRELDSLRRLEQISGKGRPLAAVLSRGSLEPGIFGIVRPVLIWPAGISPHFEDAHLEAVLAHELCHVRRHDNLTAALHMVVEAIFWFHPLVWWIGRRLGEERERACDEHVMALGREPRVYAESILKTCEFCVQAPLACVSGVTGDDLKQRIVRIMAGRFAENLSFRRKLLLSSMATASLAGPVIFGVLHAPRAQAQSTSGELSSLAFEVASIKPDHLDGHHVNIDYHHDSFIASGVTLRRLVGVAYNVADFQLSGGPAWADSETYQIQARIGQETVAALNKLPLEQEREQYQAMLERLLEERFRLKVTHSSKQLPVYALVLTKTGPKFSKSISLDRAPDSISDHNGEVTAKATTMGRFAEWLSSRSGRKVVDNTGLDGRYDFEMKYDNRRQALVATLPREESPAASDSSGPSVFAALRDQLGLELKSEKGPVEILTIESAQKPSPN